MSLESNGTGVSKSTSGAAEKIDSYRKECIAIKKKEDYYPTWKYERETPIQNITWQVFRKATKDEITK